MASHPQFFVPSRLVRVDALDAAGRDVLQLAGIDMHPLTTDMAVVVAGVVRRVELNPLPANPGSFCLCLSHLYLSGDLDADFVRGIARKQFLGALTVEVNDPGAPASDFVYCELNALYLEEEAMRFSTVV